MAISAKISINGYAPRVINLDSLTSVDIYDEAGGYYLNLVCGKDKYTYKFASDLDRAGAASAIAALFTALTIIDVV